MAAKNQAENILVTGGLGFIGSHTCVSLIEAGYNPVIIDSLENSHNFILDRIAEITDKKPVFYKGDCRDKALMQKIFSENNISGVIHFAAYKAVGESVKNPVKYFDNNLSSLWILLDTMSRHQVCQLVFSSSCTVYGNATNFPVTEDTAPGEAMSPYGYTKQACEKLITWFTQSRPGFKSVLLRYFNPIGAHPTALLGEWPVGVPDNLIPYITQTVAGIRNELTVFGTDYNTKDGSCIRDYIHVCDLADAHAISLQKINDLPHSPEIINLGTGTGHSVLEVIETFEQATGKKVNFTKGPRRPGDIPVMYASVLKADKLLKWKPKFTLTHSLQHAWQWQLKLGKNE
jgi:UDP-glucose 4-epimerase